MEALAADSFSFEFDQLGVTPDYNPETNSFSSRHHEGIPVRQVTEKRLPARGITGCIVHDKFDIFTGIIDLVTGEPLHGVRHYSLTGELYEGKFRSHGLRHGDGAIVKNITLPPPREAIPELMGEFVNVDSPHSNLSYKRANFFGTYVNDEPSFGTLVTDTYSYRGHFVRGRFHGLTGELIHSDGFTYKGEFQEGLFHGMGREIEPATPGEYQGEFRNGMKHGMGTFKEGPPEDFFNKDEEDVVVAQKEDDEAKEAPKDGKLEDNLFENRDWGYEFTDNDCNPEDTMDNQAESETFDPDVSLSNIETASKRYVYSGFFHCNQRQGEGTEWTKEGEVFSGLFLANRRHGHGSLKTVSTGIIYEGKWRGGKPVDGNGWRILFPEGDIYCGHVQNFKPHGYGIYQHSSGDVFSGDWTRGRRNGNGIHSDPNGTEFSGRWEDDKVVTRKRLEETDGTLSEIAETLRIIDSSSGKDNEQQAGDATEEEQNASDSHKHEKQLAFLKQAMAKSIETSLHIIASKSESSEDFESFSDSAPETRRRTNKRSTKEVAKTKPRAELHAYANGDTYLGALDSESFQRTGYGVYVSKATGCSYTGVFKNNKRHGFGILIHSQFGKYAGEFCEDKKHGEGTLILSDASSFHGVFANGAFDGKGTLCERDGTVYVGEWRAGLRNGEGMETMSDGRVFKGTFKNGKREGSGTLLEKSAGKIIYRGPWRDGKFHGEGMLIVRKQIPSSHQVNIVRWEGAFAAGKKHGYGVLSNETDNSEWKGVWSHDKPVSGKWRVKYKDGGLYAGQAQVLDEQNSSGDKVVAVPEGFGTFQYANGDVYVGNFEYGIRNGVGTCKFTSGEQWEGAWTNDHLDKHGSGVLTLADGKVHEFKGKSSVGKLFNSGHDGEIETTNYMM
mmetsp:Transcript_18964/g.31439  ORF Transcript_18964/g.31439 Transcript_18964/m.31439 type:complete len:897 (+) Transcript_18964:125-2815(+)|eukprot:CAMPEP_0119022924 /NCGR_PEP_ID=MMETSP1176-20130426/29026_1 /TAXON_ID=265551 /ORGANISM="Synedropsis recta cf, Strain CCMP1620" /LENGTH=896 /DNA_ID=CAMNT_0006977893 /DNA_START=16 /DNA_END=2706 /DNA_ORIENTATION=+